jgi:hypothetical protein
VRFIFSTRSARKASLRLPAGTPEVECPGFTLPETAQFAGLLLPGASDAWMEQFHALSHGIPRVQDYAISAGSGDLSATLDALRPNGKGVAEVLKELFHGAAKKIGNEGLYSSFVSALAALPAPVPVPHLAAVSGMSESEVRDLISDIQPSLRLEPEGASIADEDVESFIHAAGAGGLRETQKTACEHFSRIYRSDGYAATHYADLLVETGRASEVLPIVENDLVPAAISDPIVRREVQVRRLRLALSACHSAGNSVASLKVILLSAEASKGEDALTEILQKESDLAVRFARGSLLRLVLADPDNACHQGAVLAQDAVRAARKGERIQAREQLHYHNVWLERQKRVEDHEKHKWSIEYADIIARAEAKLFLNGPESAIQELRCWQPKHVALAAGLKLIPALIARGNGDVVIAANNDELLPAGWRLLLLVPLALSGIAIDPQQLNAALRLLRRPLVPKLAQIRQGTHGDNWGCNFLELIVTACEIAFACGVDNSVIRHAIELIADFNTISSGRYFRSDAPALDVILRAWLIHRSITAHPATGVDFANFIDPPPPEEKKPHKRTKKGARRAVAQKPPKDEDLRCYVGAIFNVYASRVSLLQRSRAGEAIDDTSLTSIGGLTDEYDLDRDLWGSAFRTTAARSVMRLMHLNGLSAQKLFAMAKSLGEGRSTDPFGDRLMDLWNDLLLRGDCRAFVLASVVEKAATAKVQRVAASSKVRAFVEFSRLLLNFSEADAKVYFEEAVAQAQDLDREAFDQIEVLSALTKHFAAWDSIARTEIACRAFGFITDVGEHLRDEEHFPWSASVRALSRLSPPVALAAIARWADQGLTEHSDTLLPFIRELLALGMLPPSCAVALLVLLDSLDHTLVEEILKSSSASDGGAHDQLAEQLSADCLLNIPVSDRDAVSDAIIANSKSTAGLSQQTALDLLKQTAPLLAARQRSGHAQQDAHPRDDEPQLDLSGRKFVTVSDVERGISDARALERYCSVHTLLNRMTATIRDPGEMVPFLNAVATYESDRYDEEYRVAAILDALESWKDVPSVAHWGEAQLPEVIIGQFLRLAGWPSNWGSSLRRVMSGDWLTAAERRRVLIEGAERTGLDLGSRSLFGIAELLAAAIEPDDAWEVVEWYISRLEQRVHPGSNGHLDPMDVPTTLDGAIGRFVFALMTDVDTRIRWRAAHVARRLARLEATTAFLAIFENYDRLNDPSYRDPEAPFYWLAGRLWAVMSAARVADEKPSALLPMLDRLAAIATDRKLPHMLIREHAKSAVLTLVHHGRTVPPGILEAVRNSNIPKLARVATDPSRRPHMTWEDTKERRFRFDAMDTVQYWYIPLLRQFADLGKVELLDELERWIVDEWHAPHEVHQWDTRPRKARFSDRRYQLWSHSHGGLPIIGRYGTYLEWHAMFCAAGALIEKRALAKSEYEGDSLEHWIEANLLTAPPLWLTDMRDPSPLDPSLWVESTQSEQNRISRASKNDFLSAVQPIGNGIQSFVTVEGSWKAAFTTREVRTEISSALVTSGTAAALARALQAAERPYGFRFPDEGDDQTIDNPPYRLIGWLRHESRDAGLDRRDPFRHDITSAEWKPGQKILSAFNLQPAPPPRKEWMSAEGWVALRYRVLACTRFG